MRSRTSFRGLGPTGRWLGARAICLALAAMLSAVSVVGCSNPMPSPTRSGSSSERPSVHPSPTASPVSASDFVATGSMLVARSYATATVLRDGRVLVAGGWSYAKQTAYSSSELYDPATGTFTLNGSMTVARAHHSATLLADGRVLIAGGNDGSTDLASAELYDPATGDFSPSELMTTAHSDATTILLADGRVLIAGGNYSTSAEIYDPKTGTFSPTGAMSAHRQAPAAALLRDGRVLFAGGYNALQSAEVYDPATGSFSPTGSMAAGRGGATATLLRNGRVLVAGGTSISAELYDPATGRFSLATLPHGGGKGSTATLLADGRVLLEGRGYPSWPTPPFGRVTADLYDPTTGQFYLTGPMIDSGDGQAAVLLHDGRVLIAGGYADDGRQDLSSAELYVPNASAEPTPSPWPCSTDARTNAVEGQSATRLADGEVLIAGGNDGSWNLATAELYDPATGSIKPTGSMTIARNNPTATLLADGRVLITGGQIDNPSLEAFASAEIYDPKTGTFSSTGSMTTARVRHTATLLRDGRVLITGGLNGSGRDLPDLGNSLASAEIYDPTTGTFSATGSMTTLRWGPTATLLLDGRVLVVGGGGPLVRSSDIYDPTIGSFSASGSMITGRQATTSTLLPDGRVLIAGGSDIEGGRLSSAELYTPSSGTISPTGSMTEARNGLTATLLGNGRVLVTGGDLRVAGNAESFNPATGTFGPAGSLLIARSMGTSTTLADGRVLLTGGGNACVEVYQP